MDYVLLIYAAEDRDSSLTDAQRHAMHEEYGHYTREVAATGKLGDCAALESIRTATSVRIRGGKRVVTDGPFAETREQLGGYYVVSADSEEDALALGAKIPGARHGSIEVRPVTSMGPSDGPSPKDPGAKKKEYILLIHEPEIDWGKLDPSERKSLIDRYNAFTKSLRAHGAYLAGSPLQSVKTAKTVRVPSGARLVTDGPFAETREQLGGYYRVMADHLDQALDFAAGIPAAENGTIEVRPIMDLSAYV